MNSLSSIVIGMGAGVIAALIAFISSQKKNKLDYIEAERKSWRDNVREIAKLIQEATLGKDIISHLAQLKLRINAYGACDQLDIFHDGHIWALIGQIENDLEENNYSRLHGQKKKLNRYLSCLLKHNWEKSKKEIRGEGFIIANYAIIPIALILECTLFQPMIGLTLSIDIFAFTFVFYAMLFLEIYQMKNLFYMNEKRVTNIEGKLFYQKIGIMPMILWTSMNLMLIAIYSFYLVGINFMGNDVLSQIQLAAGSIIIKLIVIIMTIIFLRNIQNMLESLCQKYIAALNYFMKNEVLTD